VTDSAEELITLAISVVCYDSTAAELQVLLNSLLTALEALPAAGIPLASHISLVDNSDAHRLRLQTFAGFEPRLRSLQAELRIVQGHGNVGYGRGHNLVIQTSEDRYHLVLNPDVELAPDSLVVGLSYLEDHPETAVVSPYAESGEGHKQHLCKRHPSLLTLLVRGFLPGPLRQLFARRLARYEMHDLPEDRPSDGIPLVSGCCMLCRGETLRAIEGFDEHYFLYFEDFDLSLRLASQARVVYLPFMKIRHHGGQAARKGLRHIAMFARSAWRFFNQYGWRFIQ
jgi:GT2 family glycosyltransferase